MAGLHSSADSAENTTRTHSALESAFPRPVRLSGKTGKGRADVSAANSSSRPFREVTQSGQTGLRDGRRGSRPRKDNGEGVRPDEELKRQENAAVGGDRGLPADRQRGPRWTMLANDASVRLKRGGVCDSAAALEPEVSYTRVTMSSPSPPS